MEHLLPHEVAERELEMQEAAEIEERPEQELRVAEFEVEKSLSVEELVVEYTTSFGASTTMSTTTMRASPRTRTRTRMRLTSAGGTRSPPTAACRQDKSSTSHLTPAMHRPARRRIF